MIRLREASGLTMPSRRWWVLLSLFGGGAVGARAQAPPAAVWDSVGRVLQSSPTPAVGYVRFGFPRRDLTLRVGDVAVAPRLALGAWAGFTGNSRAAMMMGDLVVTESELLPVEAAIDSQQLAVTAVHNHLVGESPRIIYIHFHGEGPPLELARRLDRVLAHTGTPRGVAAPASAPVTIDTAAIFAALGARGTASGAVAQIVVLLVSGPVQIGGAPVAPAFAAGSPINIQAVSADRFVATGDFAVTGDRVAPLVATLAAHGITTTGVHSHLIGESPPLYYVHFWADGTPTVVLEGLKASLDAARAAP